jgi:hypothetical protein
LNALLRDQAHAGEFLSRHRNQLLFGSDCDDAEGHGARCSGAHCLAALRKLMPDPAAFRQVAYGNAFRILTKRKLTTSGPG